MRTKMLKHTKKVIRQSILSDLFHKFDGTSSFTPVANRWNVSQEDLERIMADLAAELKKDGWKRAVTTKQGYASHATIAINLKG